MAAAVSRAFRLPAWTREGRASNTQFPPSSALRATSSVSVPSQVLRQNIVHRALQQMKNLLKLADSHESDCFLMKAEDARRDWNYLWDLSISPSRATWETIRGQHATQNEICSCQINHLEIFPCLFTSISLSREILPGNRTDIRAGRDVSCVQGGPPRDPTLPGTEQRTGALGPGAVLPSCLLSVGSGASQSIFWA